MVDAASGWTEYLPVWGKDQQRIRSVVHRMRQRLPFSLLGVDSDKGGEFINQCFYTYCRREKITFTRSRAYKVNKVYDTARTPYQQLLEYRVLTEVEQQELAVIYHNLNPVYLLKQINESLGSLWKLAVRSASLGNRNYESTRRPSVTV